jgi:beta-lactamase class C
MVFRTYKSLVSLLVAAATSFLAPASADILQRAAIAQIASPQIIADVQLMRFDENLRRAMSTGDFVGLAVAVVRDGEITFLRTYGETEIGRGEAITPDTLFRIASLSKGFASTMTGIAVSEGRLSLDAPATGFAPELALPGNAEKSLTLASLLSQRTIWPRRRPS